MVISKRFKPFIPLIISLLFAIVLFFLVEDFLRTVILQPLLYVIWFVTLIVESLPQGLIWAGFILVVLIIAYASLRKGNPEITIAEKLPSKNSGQVEKWARILDRAQRDRFTKWRLANELKRLTRRLLSPTREQRKFDYHKRLELPPEITAYFEAQQPTKTTFWDWVNNKTIEGTETELDLDPEVVIQYLEKRLRP